MLTDRFLLLNTKLLNYEFINMHTCTGKLKTLLTTVQKYSKCFIAKHLPTIFRIRIYMYKHKFQNARFDMVY